MPGSLTAGFDFSVQLSEDLVQRIFRTAYYNGTIPSLIKKQFVMGSTTENAELYLSEPSLRFHATGVDKVKLIFPYIVRLDSLDHELYGEMSVLVPVVLEDSFTQDAKLVQTLVVDLKDLDEQDITITMNPPSAQTLFLSAAVNTYMAEFLSTTIFKLPFSPTVAGTNLFIATKIFTDHSFVPPPFEIYSNHDYLAIFINLNNVHKALPVHFGPQLSIEPTSAAFQGWSEDAMTAIPADFFMDALHEGLKKAGLGTFPAKLPDDHSVIFNSLHFELKTGYIHVTGNVTKIIAGIIDPSVDFSANVSLGIWNNKLEITLTNVNIDLPLWAQALHFFLPFLGTILLSAVQRAVEAISGTQISIPLPEFSFLLGKIKVSSIPVAEEPSVIIDNSGNPDISPSGILLNSSIKLNFPKVPIKTPQYVTGHTTSKEFHVKGCYYGDKIKPSNSIRFIRPDVALKAGYNGCAFCQPEFDKYESGNVSLHFVLPHQAVDQHMTKTVNFTMSLIEAMGKKGSIAPQTHTVTMQNFVGNNGIYDSAFLFEDLMPGVWHLGVSCDSWGATSFKRVYSDRTRRLKFTFGQDGCKKC